MLLLPESTDFELHAQEMVEAMFDAFRLSPVLRKGGDAA